MSNCSRSRSRNRNTQKKQKSIYEEEKEHKLRKIRELREELMKSGNNHHYNKYSKHSESEIADRAKQRKMTQCNVNVWSNESKKAIPNNKKSDDKNGNQNQIDSNSKDAIESDDENAPVELFEDERRLHEKERKKHLKRIEETTKKRTFDHSKFDNENENEKNNDNSLSDENISDNKNIHNKSFDNLIQNSSVKSNDSNSESQHNSQSNDNDTNNSNDNSSQSESPQHGRSRNHSRGHQHHRHHHHEQKNETNEKYTKKKEREKIVSPNLENNFEIQNEKNVKKIASDGNVSSADNIDGNIVNKSDNDNISDNKDKNQQLNHNGIHSHNGDINIISDTLNNQDNETKIENQDKTQSDNNNFTNENNGNNDDEMWIEREEIEKKYGLHNNIFYNDDESNDEDEIGPRMPEEMNTRLDRRDYGGAMLPGEADAIANFVQRGMRIPRRGEVGLTSEEIASFEMIGYVMSGSRHKKMNAIRIRKENQIYSAEEKRALNMVNFEEKLNREKKLMAAYQKMLNNKRTSTIS